MNRIVAAVLLSVTIASIYLCAHRLQLSPDLSLLFPDRGAAAALSRYTRAFGGGDIGTILLRGEDSREVEQASHDLVRNLKDAKSIDHVIDRSSPPKPTDASLAWQYAYPSARERLAQALRPEGMRSRLDETRSLLLAPGASLDPDFEEWLARDPLRLSLLPWEQRGDLAAGLTPQADGSFVADEGRGRLIAVQPNGSAFDSQAVNAYMADIERSIDQLNHSHPSVHVGISGGHATAHATAKMLKRDLAVSGGLSLALASLVFLIAFRRVRALVAILPPLLLGTLWTSGLFALSSGKMSAIATAFASVVVGVGIDTGVHVYAALLDGRRKGLTSEKSATFARQATWRPTLAAAVAAGCAFGSLALSDLEAIRQFGLLCAAGEVLTAIAILLITPQIGALLERDSPPARTRPNLLIQLVSSITSSKRRSAALLLFALVPVFFVITVGLPHTANAIVAIRPRSLAPLAVQEEIYRLFGGQPGQWIVLSTDSDKERVRERADAIAEAIEPFVENGTINGFDSITRFAPSILTQKKRLLERDALELPKFRHELERALLDRGFDIESCAKALDAFAHPSNEIQLIDLERNSPLSWLARRHIASDKDGTMIATYVRPATDSSKERLVLEAIKKADPSAVVTGYPHLEVSLKESLAHDLPRVALLALVLVAITLRTALRRIGDVALAFSSVVITLSLVAILMILLNLKWHVYDALVLPVLVGITIDESMFILHAARNSELRGDRAIDVALEEQGPLVVSTALTTAAGFAALLACKFDGLFDLGAVGALGSVSGLFCALIVVPAGLRLMRP